MKNNDLAKLNNDNYKCGYVCLIARPNVGKSTLLNYITGQKIAITTSTAQTTRKQIKGIYTDNEAQIIFVDTPGVHKPINELGEYLGEQSKGAIGDVDIVLFLVDIKDKKGKGDEWIVQNYLKNIKKPVIIVANKSDLIKRQALHAKYIEFIHPITKKMMKFESPIPEDIKRLMNY